LCVAANTKTPRSKQKRVARLDKIMDDMKRHRKMDEESSHGLSPTERAAAALEKWKDADCLVCKVAEKSFVEVQTLFSRPYYGCAYATCCICLSSPSSLYGMYCG